MADLLQPQTTMNAAAASTAAPPAQAADDAQSFRPGRRRWLRAGAAALALPTVGVPTGARADGRAITTPGGSPGSTTDTTPAAQATPAQAWVRAFEPPRESFGPATVTLTRPLPAGFAGTLYRNGPARMSRGDTRYHHWFDGDGLIQSLAFAGNQVRHHARMIRTDKYRRDEAAGRFVHHSFGTTIAGASAPPSPDAINVANIAVLPIGGELLALWEAGSPWRIDPDTLATRGRKVWSEDTDGLPFSAHPKRDRDGSVWSFGYTPGSGKLVLYRLDAAGQMRSTALVEADRADMVHDFAITGRWLVFVLMPLIFDADRQHGDGSFATHYRWDATRGGQVLLVDKADLSRTVRIDMPALPFFHIGNAYDDGDTVRIQLARSSGIVDALDQIVDVFEGRFSHQPPVGGEPAAALTELVVDHRAGRVRTSAIATLPVEFPSVDPRLLGRRARWLTLVTRSDAMPDSVFGFDSVARIDVESGTVKRFHYGRDLIAEEHLFVPDPDRADHGWVVGTALNWRRRETLVSVFDADAIDAGPIAQARLPYGLPLGLHGSFVR